MRELREREIPGPKSAELLKVSHTYEPPCVADQVPVVWDHGEGVWVTDVDGNEYIDFTSGVLVTNIGHSHPAHVEAIRRQAGRLMNCYSFPTPERVTLSRRLVEHFPPNLDNVFLLTTGSDATEAALRVAKRYTGKFEVMGFYGAFHGRSYGAMSVAGSMGTRWHFGPPVPGGVMAPYAYCYRCFYGQTFPDCDYYCLKALDTIVASSTSGALGAVIVEPYQGSAGFIFPPDGWLKRLETWAREHDLLLIIDEVQSGFGRTGKFLAIEWEDVRPQLLCLGKGLGSGLPASALASESRVLQCMRPGELSSTWGGNPLVSASSLAVLDVLEGEGLVENARKLGEIVGPRFQEMQARHRALGDARGRGLVFGLEIVDPQDGWTPSGDLTVKILHRCAEKGLLLGRVGAKGHVIRIAPPLVITAEEVTQGIDIIDAVLTELG